MIRTYKNGFKAVSLTVVFMLVLSMLTPMLSVSIKADDKPAVTETDSQVIHSFNLRLISGAENQGSEDNPLYIWNMENTASNHSFVYQIDYHLSGTGDIPAGKMGIVLPKHIIKNRYGNYADSFEIAFPQASEVPESDIENDFVYIDRGNDYLIYNRMDLTAAQEGAFQFSYRPSQQYYKYKDNSYIDAWEATLDIDRGEGEKLHTSDSTSSIMIDSYARITGAQKQSRQQYTSWQSSWGNYADFGIDDPTLYNYVFWIVETRISAAQPYVLTVNEDMSGPYGDVSFVGMRFAGQSKFSSNMVSPVMTGADRETHYIITKTLKSDYDPHGSYILSNKITIDLHPLDNIDPDTQAVSTARFTKHPDEPSYPSGHVEFYKYCYDDDPKQRNDSKVVNL